MATAFIATHPLGRWQARCEALSPLAWLGLQAAALWPHWRWAGARLADGSDDPLGLAALAALGLWVAQREPLLRGSPRRAWAFASAAVTIMATLALFFLPPLLGAVLAVLALAAGLRSVMPSGQPWLPVAGLAVLALPVVSSLQFYAGYPLRVVTAEISTWVLQLAGLAAERSGTAMLVEGELVIVDAPCSGVQMVWMAYFCACAVAAFSGLRDRAMLARLPLVGLLVLAGNVLRNSVLVTLEAQQASVSEAVHQGVGLVVLLAVCGAVVAVMRGGRDAQA
ncbi:exosortase Q [Piscinibacter sp. HJYY11]|uniref:exosortase Q n=1 Tax=Piscinibacter sp. HJYY11 TaxID=2801333 RepID=UPI00191DEA10|nr:exosortase Q [Piscinibacter sp. HJYY11]MBL0729364.1 exosortase Q [Piscinibacter sp. HJYY11]